MARDGGADLGVRAFEHHALVYDTPEAFLAFATPFVTDGIAAGEPVFVAVGPSELSALETSIGGGTGVRLADTNEWCPTPAVRLRAFHRFVTGALEDGAMHIRLMGEPLWPTRPEYALEWARYESVLNAVMEPLPVALACTYDAARLDPRIVADARRTHPSVSTGDGQWPSPDFVEPSSLLEGWNPPLPPAPEHARAMLPPVDPAPARVFVIDRAAAAGVGDERAKDLALAVTEVLTNAAKHGTGARSLRTWVANGQLVCQIDDDGHDTPDPLAGYRPPSAEQETGRGLWIARQMVDLLRIVSGPIGTSVRLSVRIG